MPKFRVSYGIRGSAFNVEELEFTNEDYAWDYVNEQVRELVGGSVERIDPLSEHEIRDMKFKAISAMMELPSECRKELLTRMLKDC